MKIVKYFLYVVVCLLFVSVCIGCGSKKDSEKKEEEKVVGGYSIASGVAGTLPDNALKAFKKAVGKDDKYVPIACMGTQVVAGTNYMILAKEDDKLVVLVIYEDLDKNATITNTYDFNISDYITDNKDNKKDSNISGGWTVPNEGNLNAMPQQLASAWSESFSNYKDIELEVLACLGTQVVAGTNYAMLARGTYKDNLNLYLVVIYEDLDNNASITSVSYIDLAEITNK